MALSVIRKELTSLPVDAVVCPTDGRFTGVGGADGAIHRAAGPRLDDDLVRRDGLRVGEAILTNGYRLPAKYILLTRGPEWKGGAEGEADELARCYQSCLRLAKDNGCRTLAFPLISVGRFGFPGEFARQIAEDAIRDWLREEELEVFLVI